MLNLLAVCDQSGAFPAVYCVIRLLNFPDERLKINRIAAQP